MHKPADFPLTRYNCAVSILHARAWYFNFIWMIHWDFLKKRKESNIKEIEFYMLAHVQWNN